MADIDLSLIANYALDNNKWPDTAVILNYVKTGTDEAGKPIYGYIAGASFKCRFRPLTPSESEPDAETEIMYGMLHCPRGTDLSKVDRIRLTHKWNIPLGTPKDFELIGDPTPNALELTIQVNRATGDKT